MENFFFFLFHARISFLCLNSRSYSVTTFWHCSQMRPWPCASLSVALYSTAVLSGHDSMTCFPASLWIAAGTSLQPVYKMKSKFKEIQQFFFLSTTIMFLPWLCYYTISYVCMVLHCLTMPSRSDVRLTKKGLLLCPSKKPLCSSFFFFYSLSKCSARIMKCREKRVWHWMSTTFWTFLTWQPSKWANERQKDICAALWHQYSQ